RASRAVLLGAASALALTVAGTGSAFAQATCVTHIHVTKNNAMELQTSKDGRHRHDVDLKTSSKSGHHHDVKGNTGWEGEHRHVVEIEADTFVTNVVAHDSWADSSGDDSFACGPGADAHGDGATALGDNADARGNRSTAV